MASSRTMCVHGWNFLRQLMGLGESHSASFHFSSMWVWGVRPEGQCCPSLLGVALGRGRGWADRKEPAPYLPPTSPWNLLLPPLGSPGRGMCLRGCLAFPHLTTSLQQHPYPPCFFFLEGLGPAGGEARPQHTVAQCLRPQASRPALYNAFVVCFFPPMGGWGACVGPSPSSQR